MLSTSTMTLRVLAPALLLAACGGAKPEPVGPAGRSESAPLHSGPASPAPAPSPAPVVASAEPAAAPAPVKAAPAKKIRTVEGITEYQLDNGLQVLLFPDPTQSTLTVNITYLVGSRFEGYGETGMAHLLEHMMFKG